MSARLPWMLLALSLTACADGAPGAEEEPLVTAYTETLTGPSFALNPAAVVTDTELTISLAPEFVEGAGQVYGSFVGRLSMDFLRDPAVVRAFVQRIPIDEEELSWEDTQAHSPSEITVDGPVVLELTPWDLETCASGDTCEARWRLQFQMRQGDTVQISSEATLEVFTEESALEDLDLGSSAFTVAWQAGGQ